MNEQIAEALTDNHFKSTIAGAAVSLEDWAKVFALLKVAMEKVEFFKDTEEQNELEDILNNLLKQIMTNSKPNITPEAKPKSFEESIMPKKKLITKPDLIV